MELKKELSRHADILIGKNGNKLSKKYLKQSILNKSFHLDPIFWNNGVLIWSIAELNNGDFSGHTNSLKITRRSRRPNLVDNVLYFYGIYNTLSNEQKHSVFSFITTRSTDKYGSIMYRESSRSAFLDTLGMICPFLARYSQEYDNQQALDILLAQFKAFIEHGTDQHSRLLYHGYTAETKIKEGVVGWGRGMGWLLIGLSESILHISENKKEFTEMKNMLETHIETVVSYQKDNGHFSWQLQATDGHYDTSATAMLGLSILNYSKLFSSTKYNEHLKRIHAALLDNIEGNCIVKGSSAECRGFSMYPQKFENNSWGQGFTLLFLTRYADI